MTRTCADQYRETVRAIERLQAARATRRDGIAEEVAATMHNVTLGASMAHVVNGRVATDPVMRDLQVQIDRMTMTATMYGIGAIMELLKEDR